MEKKLTQREVSSVAIVGRGNRTTWGGVVSVPRPDPIGRPHKGSRAHVLVLRLLAGGERGQQDQAGGDGLRKHCAANRDYDGERGIKRNSEQRQKDSRIFPRAQRSVGHFIYLISPSLPAPLFAMATTQPASNSICGNLAPSRPRARKLCHHLSPGEMIY